ncbi:MAG: phosphoribosylamine--glycine ligase [Candidatus Jacksonbacteria bacterium RIFOXYC2_FULL_44_29]|nr:MAG: Phosphoribosylamine-glycine ligase [Parcubacteria group bacterium GW2011_GWA2_42_28]KKT52154.1 MAG: Phosphoribosylamine-glycine ligase [Parcubacteria group bacterium GW2011_GWC2_44_22]OGY75563.1 MAG: phosphoribosylamine--glycine ligase [Candidatus Jacksonbacteria bacterium RIFOXYB2_FULL_44_15]OGY75851.1 MAG: phosphoribosylamine--glycine ligase [Candidatus Jacksonbacteria bacterium RIFOXYA2_FULL_43_12]OGY78556.1 MAG: phosphoribosylamine--glycine ligase [Candidatus Jacksonbacteria bacteri
MKVLVLGGGGREHALIWKIAKSTQVSQVYSVPGNAGIGQMAGVECYQVDVGKNFAGLIEFSKKKKIDLTVVGPEAPLVNGMVDAFEAAGLHILGPTQSAAKIEGSKVWAKELMERYAIPTAPFKVFDSVASAMTYLTEQNRFPIVVKADGLTGGKGAIVCGNLMEATTAVVQMMVDKEWGDAGNRVVIEDYLDGEEASFIVLTDGVNVVPLASSQDHKAIYEGGPNTGGMGAYSPAPVVTPEMHERIMREIIKPTITAMVDEGRLYRGVLYAGLMITADGPKVLEYNCRCGDPETQPIMVRLESDIVPALLACIDGTLDQVNLKWNDKAAVCVVMASGGYPGQYEKGKVITGLDAVGTMEDVVVFHSGTALDTQGQFVTAGGRVLGVTALGEDIRRAQLRAYQAVDLIKFEDEYHRTDIAWRAINR